MVVLVSAMDIRLLKMICVSFKDPRSGYENGQNLIVSLKIKAGTELERQRQQWENLLAELDHHHLSRESAFSGMKNEEDLIRWLDQRLAAENIFPLEISITSDLGERALTLFS